MFIIFMAFIIKFCEFKRFKPASPGAPGALLLLLNCKDDDSVGIVRDGSKAGASGFNLRCSTALFIWC